VPEPRGHVLFVGAGLSAAFGFALTSEILPELLRRWRSGELFERALEDEASALRFEFEGLLRAFMPEVTAAATDDLPAITDLLSLLDQFVLARQSPSPEMTADDVTRLRSLFELGICELLSLSLRPTVESETAYLLDLLADWIVTLGQRGTPVTVVTTNYDFVLEDAICRRLRYLGVEADGAIDYGFTWRSTKTGELRHRPIAPMARFIRLHGAINWLRCRMCGFVYINQWGPIFHQTDRASDDRGNTCHCQALRLQRVIVAPSIVRRLEDTDIHTAWKAALEELRLAGRWTILGYSLPNEDVAIRSIFIRALRGRREPPLVEVFEKNSALEPRYRILFGNIKFSAAGAQEFVRNLARGDTPATTS
jgi:hypothetical protein